MSVNERRSPKTYPSSLLDEVFGRYEEILC
jgi:hypothetical protein